MSGNTEWLAWIALFGGAGMVLVGLLKIIISGAKLLAWMVVLGVGLVGMGFAVRHYPPILEASGMQTEMAKSIQSFLAPKQ